MKTIMGIDPGTTETAYTILQIGNDLNWCKLLKFGKVPNDEFRFILKAEIVKNYLDKISIEGLQSFGMPVGQTTFQTAYMIGRFMQICEGSGYQANMVYRGDIKSHFCQSRKAKDGNIRQALINRFGEPGVKKTPGILYGVSADVWSSTAIAVYTNDVNL